MAVGAHEGLSIIGIDSELVGLEIEGKESYGHLAIQINHNVYEPRYLGLYRQNNINYEQVVIFESTDELLQEYSFLPSIDLVRKAIMEMIIWDYLRI